MSQSEQATAVRARWVFPVEGPPIEHGVVTIVGERIVRVGTRPDTDAPVTDLGCVALVPGLVNAHTHLEFSDCPQPLGAGCESFAAWIGTVTRYRNERAEADALATARAVELGAAEAIASGTTALGEIATAGWQAPANTAAEMVAFREVIALSEERFAPLHAAVAEHVALAKGADWQAGISPHAPYTVHPELFGQLVDDAVAGSLPVAMHLAESRDELELLRDGAGPLVEYLADRGFWIAGAIAAGTRPLDYLQKLAEAPRALVVHGNYLDDDEIEFVAQNRANMCVVYCPRTHHFFGHERHPIDKLLARGAVVALGTDSRASNPDLNLLAEMRFVAEHYSAIAPGDALRLGTMCGAQALGLAQILGVLAPGKLANLAAISIADRRASDPHELLFEDQVGTVRTMVRGRWIAPRDSASAGALAP